MIAIIYRHSHTDVNGNNYYVTDLYKVSEEGLQYASYLLTNYGHKHTERERFELHKNTLQYVKESLEKQGYKVQLIRQ